MYTYIHTRGRRKQEKRKDILFYSYQIRQITIDYSKVYMLTNAYYYYFDRKKNNQIQFYIIGQKLNIITTSFIYIFTIIQYYHSIFKDFFPIQCTFYHVELRVITCTQFSPQRVSVTWPNSSPVSRDINTSRRDATSQIRVLLGSYDVHTQSLTSTQFW